MGKLDKRIPSLTGFLEEEGQVLPLGVRLKARNYWDFVLPALARHRSMTELFGEYGVPMHRVEGFYDDPADFNIRKITLRQMTEEEILLQTGNQMQEEILKNWNPEQIYDAKVREEIEERFSYVYPFRYLEDIPVKVSVSELKKRGWQDNEVLQMVPGDTETEAEMPVPGFMKASGEEYRGAARGTAYHRVMECLDYLQVETDGQLKKQLERLVESQKLSEQERDCIRILDIRRFVDSGLGQRMKNAAVQRRLYREQPFVIQRSAAMLDDLWQGETVLVQGIIDAYFVEDGEIVLVDYKTDRVRRGQEQKLIDLYHVQLEDYAQALERMTGKKVKEKIIYSFTLQKEIVLQEK